MSGRWRRMAALACALTVATAAADELPLKPERTIAFETDAVTWLSLDVSPDGATLLIEAVGDLYTLPSTGGAATRITEGMAFDSQPRYSPDGERIVFVSDRDGSEDVWVADANGSDARNLSRAGGLIEFASPTWAPDGSHIVVSRTRWGLGTFELWAYHVDGGTGVRITKAKARSDTPVRERTNALGAVYSPDGRYLYYARKNGGFGYNLRLPLWQIARRDLADGVEDILTQAQGSAMRPLLSPDGSKLVYATRHEGVSGLRLRDFATGESRWLAWPAQRDEQESRFTRDLFPGYAFAPDGASVFYTAAGGIRRVDVATGTVAEVPFTLEVEQALGPSLHAPHRLGIGPVKARLARGLAPSPDGKRIAFSALGRVHVRDLADGRPRALTAAHVAAFQPAWSPDGRWLAYVTWAAEGGHLWRVRSSGRGTPQRLTDHAAFYGEPVWSPDGERIVALRAAADDWRQREWDFGAPVGADVVWLPARGGPVEVVLPARDTQRPHFGPERDRIYLYSSPGLFAFRGQSALLSVRFDGTDRRVHFGLKGPGVYAAENDVPARDLVLSPDGRHILAIHANQLYVARPLNRHLANVQTRIGRPSVPLALITDVGVDEAAWSADGTAVHWSVGNHFYARPLASIDFAGKAADEPEDTKDAAEDADNGEVEGGNVAVSAQAAQTPDAATPEAETDGDDRPLAEEHEAVTGFAVEIYRPRHEPQGVLALTGATVITMAAATEGEGLAPPIPDAVVLIENDRIEAVGRRGEVAIPAAAHVMDMAGKHIVPGYVDTHAHFPVTRGVLDKDNWAFLANLAYGVTTGLDVQPSTVDILAYEDLIDAGLMRGPRALSTGPGIFNDNRFRSRRHAEAVLSRYKDHYRVRNLKAYIAGNRKQRQWLAQAAKTLGLMPTTEGSLDMKLNVTHIIDGFSGNEHNFPVLDLHPDIVRLTARSGLAYTPTLLVAYGGPAAETHYYVHESPRHDAKLNRFTPRHVLDAKTLRGPWTHPDEHVFGRIAAQAAKIIRAGGRVGVGSHGQLQGLGYHWELWALASGGLTPAEALLAATRHGAEMIGVAQDIGSVTPGKLADLVILAADPLADIRHSDDIAYVVKNGEVFAGDSLDQVWPSATPLPEQWWWGQGPAGDPVRPRPASAVSP